MQANTEKMSDVEALKILEEFIVSWTTVNNRFPEQINAHSFCIGETQIEAMKIGAARLQEKLNIKENQPAIKSGALEAVVELLQSYGFELDGHTRIARVKFITKDSYPLAGKLATFGGRLRYVLPDTARCATIGKRTVCFYKKVGTLNSDFKNIPTKDLEAIKKYITEQIENGI